MANRPAKLATDRYSSLPCSSVGPVTNSGGIRMRAEVAQNVLGRALKEAGSCFLFSTSHWQECRCNSSVRAATLGHEMEAAS